MGLKFEQKGLIDEQTECGEILFLSKAPDIEDKVFEDVIQIIDETGNEVNCTIEKFIEIFDNHGLEGFIL